MPRALAAGTNKDLLWASWYEPPKETTVSWAATWPAKLAATAAVDRWDSELRNALSQVEVHASRVEAASADVDRQRAALGNAKDRARDAEEALQAVQGSADKAPDAVAEAFEKALEEAETFLATADAHETQTRNTLHAMEREREALAARLLKLFPHLHTNLLDGLKAVGGKGRAEDREALYATVRERLHGLISVGLEPWVTAKA